MSNFPRKLEYNWNGNHTISDKSTYG